MYKQHVTISSRQRQIEGFHEESEREEICLMGRSVLYKCTL